MKMTKEDSVLELINVNQLALLEQGKEIRKLQNKIIWIEENFKTNGLNKKD